MLLRDEHVKRRHNEQSEDRSDRHTADEHKTDRISRRSAGAGHERKRKVTGDSRDARHHDRTQTNARCLRDRSQFCQTLPLQFVRELDDQDSVLRNQTDQRHQTDLRVDVERRRPAIGEELPERHFQKHEDTRAEHRERHRAEQNDERIAEAVELRRQDEKDQHERKQKHAQKFAAFGPQLTRLAGVIDDVTFWQNLVRLVLAETSEPDRAKRPERR